MKLSPTSLAAWAQCERLYQALYPEQVKFVGVRLPAMRGTWVHKGIAGVLLGGHPRAVAAETAAGFAKDFRASKMVDVFGQPIISHQPGSSMVTEQAALVEATILGWHRTRFTAFEGWRLLQTERESTLALGASRFHATVELSIKPDFVLVHDKTQVIRPFDVKLTSTIDQEWLDQWQFAPQSFWYHFALKKLYPGSTVDPLWIEAIDVGRAAKSRHSSPLIYGWAAQARPPYDPDLIWYANPPRRARLFRAWVEEDCKVADPLALHIGRLPKIVLDRLFVAVDGVAPTMAPADIDQMFVDVLKIADQMEARTREGESFRWTGLLAGNCATPFNRCSMYRRCFRVPGYLDWYVSRKVAMNEAI